MSKATEVKYDDYGKHFNIYMVLGKTHKCEGINKFDIKCKYS